MQSTNRPLRRHASFRSECHAGPCRGLHSISGTTLGRCGLQNETLHGKTSSLYSVGLATRLDHLAKALEFVRGNYAATGYIPPETLVPTASEFMTGLAMHEDKVIGTLTLWRDGPGGIQADATYRKELDILRQQGERIAEFGRFAVAPEAPFLPIFTALVSKMADAAFWDWGLSCYILECNPRHESFYRRLFGFSALGNSRDCVQIGAPAVLLHIPVNRLRQLALEKGVNSKAQAMRANAYPPTILHATQIAPPVPVYACT